MLNMLAVGKGPGSFFYVCPPTLRAPSCTSMMRFGFISPIPCRPLLPFFCYPYLQTIEPISFAYPLLCNQTKRLIFDPFWSCLIGTIRTPPAPCSHIPPLIYGPLLLNIAKNVYNFENRVKITTFRFGKVHYTPLFHLTSHICLFCKQQSTCSEIIIFILHITCSQKGGTRMIRMPIQQMIPYHHQYPRNAAVNAPKKKTGIPKS